MVAIAACGAGENWSATQPSASPASTAPAVVGTPTTAADVQDATDTAAFCSRARQLIDVVSSSGSPSAAEVVADARATALLARNAPPAIKQSFETVARTFAAYAAAVHRAGPDPGAQAGAVLATALSLGGQGYASAYAAISRYMRDTCHVQLDATRPAPAEKLEAFDVDSAIRHDTKFWTTPVSTSISIVMGSATVDVSEPTLDAADSLEICRDIEGVVYARVPNAEINVGPDAQHPLARSAKPGGCTATP